MIAEVIVDIANSEVDRIFDYIAPPSVLAGHRVLVPFGSRAIEGYIIALKQTSDYDASKLKPITKVLDDEPVITDEMLSLCFFMRQKYHLRIIDVLRLFVPSKMRGGRVKQLIKKYVTIAPDYQDRDPSQFIKKSAIAQMEVFEFLNSLAAYQPTANAGENKKHCPQPNQKKSNQDLSAAQEEPILSTQTEAGQATQGQSCQDRLEANDQSLPSAQEEVGQVSDKSEQDWGQSIAASFIQDGGIPLTELNKMFSAAAIRNLLARGVFLEFERSVSRTPYKDIGCEKLKNIVFTEGQRAAYENINLESDNVYLIHGVTGSGKTEIYIKTITDTLKKGKTAIMLVPEISLTPQFLRIFRSRFGDEIALLHSGLSDGERLDEWSRLLLGEAKIALGARSAIFAPLKNLGVIIIDEEHDNSYISESNPRYHTHDVALFRKSYNNCCLIMGSATPSIESYYKAVTGQYALINMPERVNKRAMPEISVINMCDEVYAGNNSLFSRKLRAELEECMQDGNQAIIFINRRGYSSYVLCRSCGYVAKCTECDVSLVYHKEENVLKCHYCNNRYAMLTVCPECKGQHLKRGFIGTQKVSEELAEMFPSKRIIRMDNDTTQGKDAHQKILSQFASKNADILVGTQMIAKGHDFPDVTLVGIVDADMSLYFADYRSNERTYQLITQVSGRAGRDTKSGKVVLQTYSPNHYVYRFAIKNDYKGFYDKECNLREVTKYPPFSKIVRVLVSSKNEELAVSTTKSIFDEIKQIQGNKKESFAFCAAMRSPVKKIQSKFRLQILMRITDDYDEIIQKIYQIADKYQVPDISLFIDINPNNLS